MNLEKVKLPIDTGHGVVYWQRRRQAQDHQSVAAECPILCSIEFPLLEAIVDRPIDFDNQACLFAIEVHDVAEDAFLRLECHPKLTQP